MAVAVDVAVTGGAASSTSGLSWSHTISSSATALTVEVGGFASGQDYAALTTHTVKVGSTPLILLGAINCNNTVGSGWVELWGLIAPPTGVQTITVVENISGTAASITGGSVSYKGAVQFGTAVKNYGTATTITSGAVVSSVGNMVISTQGGYFSTIGSPSSTSRYTNPASATTGYVTLMVQDAPGASTVTETSSYSGPFGWGAVSISLMAGNSWSVNSSLALTTGRVATGSAVGQVWHVNASLALTTTPTAVGLGLHLGSALRYVGRYPDTSSTLCPASYANADNTATAVTPAWIDQQVTIASANLVTQAWVTQQISNYMTQSQVTSALASYIPHSALGVSNGIAQLNGSDQIPSGQLPALTTNSVATFYDANVSGTMFLGTGQFHTVTTTNLNEFIIGNVTVNDPGYLWIPWPIVYVMGNAGGASSGSRLFGNDNFGLLTVTPLGKNSPVYGAGVCTDDPVPNFYECVPYGFAASNTQSGGGNMTPLTQPPISGSMTLQLGACNYLGNNYVFNGTALVFGILVLPAAGGG